MSSTLVWEPSCRKKEDLSDELKFALRKRYDYPIRVTMNLYDISYLEGLQDAGIQDAEKLIKAIEEHNGVELTEVT